MPLSGATTCGGDRKPCASPIETRAQAGAPRPLTPVAGRQRRRAAIRARAYRKCGGALGFAEGRSRSCRAWLGGALPNQGHADCEGPRTLDWRPRGYFPLLRWYQAIARVAPLQSCRMTIPKYRITALTTGLPGPGEARRTARRRKLEDGKAQLSKATERAS